MRALSIQRMKEIPNMSECQAQVSRAIEQVHDKEKAQAYGAGECRLLNHAWITLKFLPFTLLALGYYKQFAKNLGWSPATLVSEMNNVAKRGMLYEGGNSNTPPPLLARTVGKMGLKVSFNSGAQESQTFS